MVRLALKDNNNYIVVYMMFLLQNVSLRIYKEEKTVKTLPGKISGKEPINLYFPCIIRLNIKWFNDFHKDPVKPVEDICTCNKCEFIWLQGNTKKVQNNMI